MNSDAIGKSRSQFSTGSQSDGLYGLKQSLRHLCPRLNKGGEPLGKNFVSTVRIAAKELADREMKDDPTACTRNISQRPLIPTMDLR
ncbi:hypothetical protein KSC_024320 [Ktedonobacter sp. SOSP1-52]|nr:hypothetical protein KSC_024320 [Ktedonobacter sp. SOSP1-52]